MHEHVRFPLVILVVAWTWLAGCGPALDSPPTPVPTPTRDVTATDLTARWVFGDADEPAAGPVVGCYPFKVWNLTQTGERVTGSVDACIGPCAAFTEEVAGENLAGQVNLTGEAADAPTGPRTPVTYHLRFDPQTRHLVGTRNGKPFWAAPFIQKPDKECGPRPL